MLKSKILFLLLLATISLLGQSKSEYPRITIRSSSIKVSLVLEKITQQTGLDFSYNSNVLNLEERIAFRVRNVSIEEALQQLCDQLELEYVLIEEQIILRTPLAPPKAPKEFLTISGTLTDQATGERLIGATVLVQGTTRGVITNDYGYYALQVYPGNYVLSFSYVGYEPKELELELNQNQQQNLELKTTSVALPNVIVKRPTKLIHDNNLGKVQLSAEDLKNMPEFAGESGLIKGLESLPGIKTHSNGSAFFYARGGERDQNLLIIDDAPIYNPSHLFGFYSLVIPDFTRSIEVYKSDIPVSMGDRLSSIVNIRTKDGNLNKFELRGALSPFVNRVSVEFPTRKQRGSIFTSLRRSNFEWLYRRDFPNADVFFTDFIFKWNHQINKYNRLYFTMITSQDELSSTNFENDFLVAIPQQLLNPDSTLQVKLAWANFAATLRWNHIFGPKLFSNTTINTGNYAYGLSPSTNRWTSRLSSLSLKSDFTQYNSPDYTSKYGLDLQGYFIDPGSVTIDSTIGIFPTLEANYSGKVALYYSGKWKPNYNITFNAGVRAVNWTNRGPATYYTFDEEYMVQDTINTQAEVYNNYFNLDPRISFQYTFDSTSNIKLSYGRYHQYIQLISNSQSPFSYFDVWLPASPNIRPQSARQWAFNYWKYLRGPDLEFSAALYFKDFENQIDYKAHPVVFINPLLEGELRFGTMQSYGLELLLKKETGRFNGWMSYTISKTRRRTPSLNNGAWYPAFQDRPHDFSAYMNYGISDRILFSAFYTIYSGSTFSSPTGFYTFNDQTIPVYGERNNDRLPQYQRFDFAFKFLLNKNLENRFQHSLTFSIYNASNQKNVVSVNFNKIPSDDPNRPVLRNNLLSQTPLSPSQIELVRFFPSLTYKFKL